MRSTTITPRHEAQMVHIPLTVTSGANGYRLAYQGGYTFATVLDDEVAQDVPLWFTNGAEALILKREAEGVTAAMLAVVFGRTVS